MSTETLPDSISESSHYTSRSLKEKLLGPTDPHNETTDEAIPSYWPKPERNPDGSLSDPVKIAASILSDLKKEQADIAYQDFEMSGGVLKLQLVRPAAGGGETHSFLTQASYLASFADHFFRNLHVYHISWVFVYIGQLGVTNKCESVSYPVVKNIRAPACRC